MIIKLLSEGTVYQLAAPAGTRRVADPRGRESLLIPETSPEGVVTLLNLPGPLVLEAARLGRMGLAITLVRYPWPHPEVDSPTSGSLQN